MLYGGIVYQRAPNPPEFAQVRLSRVKARSTPARGYKVGCVCSYMDGHCPGILMTDHIGTNTPKFVPPRWGRPRFDPTPTGLCKFGWVWSSLSIACRGFMGHFKLVGCPRGYPGKVSRDIPNFLTPAPFTWKTHPTGRCPDLKGCLCAPFLASLINICSLLSSWILFKSL